MEQHTYRHLESLKGSDYQIVEGEPNIIGWNVKSENGYAIGEVKNLLFDPETRAVRYLVVDLDSATGFADKKVMIPIGIAHLHTSDDEVVLPGIHTEQFRALPAYEEGRIGPDTEVQIRSVIGSPAALRLEDDIEAFDSNKFYTHRDFDRQHFYTRGGVHQPVDYTEVGSHAQKPWLNEDGTPKYRENDRGEVC